MMNPPPEQIREMKAGPELNFQVHRKWWPEDVVEWRWCGFSFDRGRWEEIQCFQEVEPDSHFNESETCKRLPCTPDDQDIWQPIPAYSTDGNAMLVLWQKVEATEIDDNEIMIDISVHHVIIKNCYLLHLAKVFFDKVKDLPEAVAIAAAKAKGEVA